MNPLKPVKVILTGKLFPARWDLIQSGELIYPLDSSNRNVGETETHNILIITPDQAIYKLSGVRRIETYERHGSLYNNNVYHSVDIDRAIKMIESRIDPTAI